MIGIIILNYNNLEDTINCIKSIEQYNTAEIKIVVVDNGSCDDSADTLNSYFTEKYDMKYTLYGDICSEPILPYITLIKTGENLGYARGNNVGLQILEKDSSVDKVLILNNDILFLGDILPTLSCFLDTNEDAAIVSPLLLKKDYIHYEYNCARKNCSIGELFALYAFHGKDLFGILSRYKNNHFILVQNPDFTQLSEIEIELPSGSCMLIDKHLFKDVGYFDPHTFLYYEENILYRKLLPYHRKNYLLLSVKCVHLGGSTVGKTKFNKFQLYQNASSAYFYGINYSGMHNILKPLFYVFYKSYILHLRFRFWYRK